ncbi:MAG: hypothetical protein AAB368_11735, partial [bacterium]
LFGAGVVRADEVDDLLALRAKHQQRVKHFAAEFRVETTQPKTVKNPKTVTLRYKLVLDKLPAAAVQHAHQPWRMEAEVLEPHAMRLKVEGEQAWFLDQRGQWIELKLTPELKNQFFGMSERFMGASPSEQRKHFSVRVLRHNAPLFTPRTTTVEFVPNGASKLMPRREEDLDGDGFPLATRLFDEAGKETVAIRVTKHRKVSGVPVMEATETVSRTPAGKVTSRTTCANIQVECEGGE